MECPSMLWDHVAQYVHMHTARIHRFFNFTCLLKSFARHLLYLITGVSNNLNSGYVR